MSNTIDKILKLLSTFILVGLVIMAVLLVGIKLFGLQIYTVLSGSMEPTYHTGSLLYVKETDPKQLEVGDIITFKINENLTATHRIIELVADDKNADIIRFKTKGDANDTADGSLVESDNVVGKPIFFIPYLGYVAAYIQQPPGLYVAMVVGAVLISFVFLIDYLTKDCKKNKEEGV